MRWRGDENHWGAVAIAFHWLIALAVIGQFALGLWMTGLTYYDPWYHDAPAIHKGIGILLFFLIVLRFAWRHVTGRPQRLPEHSAWERTATTITHLALNLLLLAVMVSGYLIPTANGRGIDVFGWFTVPATFYGFEHQEDIAGAVHLILAVALISLTLLHAAAALKHHFIDHDRTLTRMLGGPTQMERPS